MKNLYKFLVLLFNLCLLLSAIILPALTLAASPAYYKAEFEKNDIYAYKDEDGNTVERTLYFVDGERNKYADLTDEQLDLLITHITEYLFTDKDSFKLEMDGVMLNGELSDGVSIFGKNAVTHMADVKNLMQGALIFGIICAAVAVGLLIFFIIKKKEVGEYIFKYSIIFFVSLITLALIFCLLTYLQLGTGSVNEFYYQLWCNIHYLLFPFQPDKIASSSFNDVLTQILSLELFLDAIIIILSIVAILFTAWFVFAFITKKRAFRS